LRAYHTWRQAPSTSSMMAGTAWCGRPSWPAAATALWMSAVAFRRAGTAPANATTTESWLFDSAGRLANLGSRGEVTYDASANYLPAAVGGVALEHDGKGRRKSGPAGLVKYNHFNLPTTMEGAGSLTGLRYDGLAQRYQRTVATLTGSETTYYEGVDSELTVVGLGDESRSTQRVVVGGRTVAELSVAFLGGQETGRQWRYFHADNRGTTSLVSNQQAGMQPQAYTAYGQPKTLLPFSTPVEPVDHRWDEVNGLMGHGWKTIRSIAGPVPEPGSSAWERGWDRGL
jgi:hypothetical protein